MTSWLDKPAPQAIASERALLGGLLQDGDRVLEIVRLVTPEAFYRRDHGALFRLIVTMAGAGVAVDLVTVSDYAMRGGEPERYGGLAYIAELPEHCPSTANLAHYAQVVREKHQLRTLIERTIGVVESAYDHDGSPAPLVTRLTSELQALVSNDGKREVWSFDDAYEDWAQTRDAVELGAEEPPLATGFHDLDQLLLGGLPPSHCTVLGGRPGAGKTGLALAWVVRWALAGRAGVFALEEGRQAMVARALQVAHAMSAEQLLEVDPFDPEFRGTARLMRALQLLDRPSVSVDDVDRAAALTEAVHGRCSFIVVDYLQRMNHRRERGESPATYIGRTAKDLLALAKKYGARLVILSQLNREVEKRAARRGPRTAWWERHAMPQASDLRESGEIEAVADLILCPVNGPQYGEDADLGALVIAKNRRGPTGVLPATWCGPQATYRDAPSIRPAPEQHDEDE